MAGSKKDKQIRQKEIPKGKSIAQGGDPEQYYSQNPAWTFANSDQEMWAFSQERLASKYIEAESLISLRVTGNHRLYGYMTGRVFNVLWYDDDHGDNDKCVCRSRLKHT